jgi:hypothetical protein
MTEKLQHEPDPSSPNSDHINPLESIERPSSQAVTEEQARDPNPFDPASIVLDQSYLKKAAAERVLLEVNVRKPKEDEYFRVHPDALFSLGPIAIITANEGREFYVLDPNLAKAEKLKLSTPVSMWME